MREKLTEDAHETDFPNDLAESQKHENTHDIEKNRDVDARDAAQLVVPWLHGDRYRSSSAMGLGYAISMSFSPIINSLEI